MIQINKTPNCTIGDYRLISSRNLICLGSAETAITPKMLAVLLALAEKQGETLSKEQLLASVWGQIATSDMVLSRAISDLRKVLGDSAKQQNYIETVSKQGYRLKAKVTWHSANDNVLPNNAPKDRNAGILPVESNIRPKSLIWPSVTLGLILLLLVGTGSRYFFMANSVEPFSNAPSLSYLTTDHHQERQVRFSNNGEYLVYAKKPVDSTFGLRIRLHSLTDHQDIRLTQEVEEGPSHEIAPVFSPDDKKIAFQRITKNDCQLVIFTLFNQQEKVLGECPNSRNFSLDWSPDGKEIITSSFDQKQMVDGLAKVEVSTGKIQNFAYPEHSGTGYFFPRYSPDGQSLAVVFWKPTSQEAELGLIAISTGKYTSLLKTRHKVNQVVWNANGDELYYVVQSSIDSGIWQLTLSSGETKHLLNANIFDLDFARATGEFSYVERNREFNIWKAWVSTNGDNFVQRVTDRVKQTTNPSLSPDNSKLVFVSTNSGSDSLWQKDLITEEEKLLLTVEHARLLEPSWSPNSKQLMLTQVDEQSSRIVQLELVSGRLEYLPSANNVSKGIWSSDSERLYWYEQIDETWQVMEMDITSGQRRSILKEAILEYQISNLNTLYYQKRFSSKIYAHSLNPDAEHTTSDREIMSLKKLTPWMIRDNDLYYSARSEKSDVETLFQLNLSTQVTTELFPVNSVAAEFEGRLSVSTQATSAYFSGKEKEAFDIVLMKQK